MNLTFYKFLNNGLSQVMFNVLSKSCFSVSHVLVGSYGEINPVCCMFCDV